MLSVAFRRLLAWFFATFNLWDPNFKLPPVKRKNIENKVDRFLAMLALFEGWSGEEPKTVDSGGPWDRKRPSPHWSAWYLRMD